MSTEKRVCPACAAPVDVGADRCDRCGAALDDDRDQGAVSAAVVDFDGDAGGDGTGDRQSESGTGDGRAAGRSRDRGRSPGTVASRSVTVAAAVVVGFLAVLLALLATGSAWGFLVGPPAFLGASKYVGLGTTTRAAVRRAGLLGAPALLSVAGYWLAGSPPGVDLAVTVLLFVGAGALVAAVGALGFFLVFGVGMANPRGW